MKMLDANGATIPALGFGTWTLKGRQCTQLVAGAIEAGYRHVDTAAMYENEDAIGEAIRNCGLPREAIHLTTKVWHSDLSSARLKRSVEASLVASGWTMSICCCIHWPSATEPLAGTLAAMNEVVARGHARHIGLSNFTIPLLDDAVRLSERPIVCNQVEYHPYLDQSKVIAACRRHDIAVVAYCPLGRRSDPFGEPAITGAARAHGKTPAQIVLRWHMQQPGVGAIPRSSNPDRIWENFDVFDFALSPAEMESISVLRLRNHRICDYDFSPQWDAA